MMLKGPGQHVVSARARELYGDGTELHVERGTKERKH